MTPIAADEMSADRLLERIRSMFMSPEFLSVFSCAANHGQAYHGLTIGMTEIQTAIDEVKAVVGRLCEVEAERDALQDEIDSHDDTEADYNRVLLMLTRLFDLPKDYFSEEWNPDDLEHECKTAMTALQADNAALSAYTFQLKQALRKHAICEHGRLGHEGKMIHNGWSCEHCNAGWKGAVEQHEADCLASPFPAPPATQPRSDGG